MTSRTEIGPITNYAQAESFILDALPMFQQVGKKAIGHYGLEAITDFLAYLGNPHLRFRSIHIAGTNGKGSVSHMLAAVYQQNGYRTGLFTSPHLKSYRERVRINGEKISEDFVLEWIQTHRQYIQNQALSFFEMSFGLACSWFFHEEVDMAIMETGLGGRLDATNVLTPILTVITNIDYDHQDMLGETLEEIAGEKAGIIKTGVPVVLGNIEPGLWPVFERKAVEVGAPLIRSTAYCVQNSIDHEIGIQYIFEPKTFPSETIHLPTKAPYQQFNLVTVLHALDILKSIQGLELTSESTHYALEHFKQISHFRGRFEIIHEKPLIIVDAAHNAGGFRFFNPLFKNKNVHLHLVLGMVKGKDLHEILTMLPPSATYYFCSASVPRAIDAHELQRKAGEYGLKGEVWSSPGQAIEEIIKHADPTDIGVVLGSIYLIAEIL